MEQVGMNTSVDSIALPNNIEDIISNYIRTETQILEKRARDTQDCQGALEDVNSLKLCLRHKIDNLKDHKDYVAREAQTLQDLLRETHRISDRIGHEIRLREYEVFNIVAQKERQDQNTCACLASANVNLERRAQVTLLEKALGHELKYLTKSISESSMHLQVVESDKKTTFTVESFLEHMLGNKMRALAKQKESALVLRQQADVKLHEVRGHFHQISGKEHQARALKLYLSKLMTQSNSLASYLSALLKHVGNAQSSETRGNLATYTMPSNTSSEIQKCVADVANSIVGNTSGPLAVNNLVVKMQTVLNNMQGLVYSKERPEDQKFVHKWEQIVKFARALEKEYERQTYFRQNLEKDCTEAQARMATLKRLENELHLQQDKVRQQKLLNDMAIIKSRSSASKSIHLIEDKQTIQFQRASEEASTMHDIIALLDEEKSLVKHRQHILTAVEEMEKAISRDSKDRNTCPDHHHSNKKPDKQCDHGRSDVTTRNFRITALESRFKKSIFQMIEKQIS
ncbi:hypothetical protein M9434_000027 [Picochlorum sp. BPE23]|nr:hypothetical protein M9434_000027 [Picochlorum sp. BPE23]